MAPLVKIKVVVDNREINNMILGAACKRFETTWEKADTKTRELIIESIRKGGGRGEEAR